MDQTPGREIKEVGWDGKCVTLSLTGRLVVLCCLSWFAVVLLRTLDVIGWSEWSLAVALVPAWLMGALLGFGLLRFTLASALLDISLSFSWGAGVLPEGSWARRAASRCDRALTSASGRLAFGRKCASERLETPSFHSLFRSLTQSAQTP